MPFQCANHSSILHIVICTKVIDAERGDSFKIPAAGSDLSIRACSWSLCKWKILRPGSGMCRFDGVHSLTAKHILHSSNKRDMSGTSTHLSLVAEPGGSHSWMVVIMWHDSEQKTRQLLLQLLSLKSCVEKNHCNDQPSQPRLQWTFPQKTASPLKSDSQIWSAVY